MRRETTTHPSRGRPFVVWPGTTLGWWALALAIPATAWIVLGQWMQDALRDRACPGRFCTGGREYVALALLLGGSACLCGLIALAGRGERSILVWLATIATTLFAAFWLVFAASEVLFPH